MKGGKCVVLYEGRLIEGFGDGLVRGDAGWLIDGHLSWRVLDTVSPVFGTATSASAVAGTGLCLDNGI